VYDIVTRQYREAPNVRGNPFAWLKGQGLLISSNMGLIAVDPLSGVSRPLVVPDLSPLRAVVGRVDGDRTASFQRRKDTVRLAGCARIGPLDSKLGK
jgi:hypothetical protein